MFFSIIFYHYQDLYNIPLLFIVLLKLTIKAIFDFLIFINNIIISIIVHKAFPIFRLVSLE
jgi:hypothetical protein